MVRLHLIESDTGYLMVCRVENVPRAGDEIRLSPDRFYIVKRIVWCFDEKTGGEERANIEVEKA